MSLISTNGLLCPSRFCGNTHQSRYITLRFARFSGCEVKEVRKGTRWKMEHDLMNAIQVYKIRFA